MRRGHVGRAGCGKNQRPHTHTHLTGCIGCAGVKTARHASCYLWLLCIAMLQNVGAGGQPTDSASYTSSFRESAECGGKRCEVV